MRSGRLFLVLTLACAAACQYNKFGDAIGRPFPGSLPGTNTAGIDVHAVTPDAALVVLDVDPTATLDNYHLENAQRAQVTFDNVPAPVNDQVPVAVGDGFLDRQSGELAVFETSSGTIESYFAWGADPAVLGSSLYFAALSAGLTTAPADVPFPLSAGAVITREGCEGCTVSPSPVLLSEVHPANGSPGTSFVEIANVSAADADISGVRICNNGRCQGLASGMVIAAGALAVVTIAADIPGDVETVLAEPGAGEPQFPLDYMRTLLAPADFETLAEDAGLWTSTAAPIGDYVPGESLSRNPGAADWFPAVASQGAVNPTIDRTGAWNSCAEPAQPAVPPLPPRLVVSVVDRAAQMVTLENTAATSIDLSTVELAVEGVAVATTGSLAGGASVTRPAVIDDTGKIELAISGTSVQFAQWGNAAAGVSGAVAANLWPLPTCLLPRIDATGALTLRDPILARGSGAYATTTR